MTLWLVRHGESRWNQAGLVQGQADAPGLTDLGVRQALAAASRVREAVGATARVELVSSDLRRALETAAIIGSCLEAEVRVDPGLRERSLGAAEGRPAAEVAEHLGVAGGQVVDPDVAPPGGESVRDVVARVAGVLGRLPATRPATDTAVVTHGGVMRVAMALAAGERPDAMAWRVVPNGSIVAYDVPGPSAASL